MHKSLLCNVTPYVKAALDGHFAEAKSAVIELPEEGVIMFKRFQLWIYTNGLLEEAEGEREVAWGTLAGRSSLSHTTHVAGSVIEASGRVHAPLVLFTLFPEPSKALEEGANLQFTQVYTFSPKLEAFLLFKTLPSTS